MKLAVVAHLVFNLLRERLAMRAGRRDGLGNGWRQYDMEALAKLSDERIRQLVKDWLDETLNDEWTSYILREYSYNDIVNSDYMTDYGEDWEALEARRYSVAESHSLFLLEKAGVPKCNPEQTNEVRIGVDEDLERAARGQFAKLSHEMLTARLALMEAVAQPNFDGSLKPKPHWVKGGHSITQRLQEANSYLLRQSPSNRSEPQQPPAAVLESPSRPFTAKVTLKDAVEVYVKAKTLGWSKSSQQAIPTIIKQFVDVLGEASGRSSDLTVAELSREHVRQYCQVMLTLPKRLSKPEFKGKRLLEFAELSLAPTEKLAKKTLNTRFNMARTFINWVGDEYGVEAGRLNKAFTMPDLQKTRGGHTKSDRRQFTQAELGMLFSPKDYLRETSKHPSRFWSPLLGLFTGMRLGEICQLLANDIREEEGVWVCDVNDEGAEGKHVKTKAGRRLVPLHPFLIESLGFHDYVGGIRKSSGGGATQIFPELTHEKAGKISDPVSKWFTRYRRRLGIGEGKDQVSRLVFHSFRHSVIHHLLRQVEAKLHQVQAVVGHEEGIPPMGSTEVYAHDFLIARLRDEVILKLTWDQEIPALAELAASPWARWK